ncbi:MAG: MarR family transcriptional regulator [Ruminococcus flavefaciens]|jgi:predicted HTH transcriptional regulator|nr:MarR family transcriptional regulator [Ruminococcus flavefaciens]
MELVFEAISENPDITIKELSTLLNISKKQVETAINKLKDAKRIHRDGSDHDGKWIAN